VPETPAPTSRKNLAILLVDQTASRIPITPERGRSKWEIARLGLFVEARRQISNFREFALDGFEVLGFKPNTRLAKVGDERPECIKDRKHRH
jgi:hypothetical protein